MFENQQIIENVKTCFNGTLPLDVAKSRLSKMEKEQLIKLVLVSCNRLGTEIKGGEYANETDALMHLCRAIEIVFGAFDIAHIKDNVPVAGNA